MLLPVHLHQILTLFGGRATKVLITEYCNHALTEILQTLKGSGLTDVEAFYVDRVFHLTLLVSRVFPTVSGWTSELLRIRQKMEVQTGCIGRGSVIERGDPEKLPRPTKIVVLEVEDKPVENPLSKAMVALAEAEEEATKGIQNLLNRMNDVVALIENTESFRIAATTAYKMLGVVPKKGNEDEHTLANLTQALAEEELDTPEILVAVENMMKVTNVLKKLAEVGPTFDIGFSFAGSNVS